LADLHPLGGNGAPGSQLLVGDLLGLGDQLAFQNQVPHRLPVRALN
jgi:hypothetical protein